MTTETEFDPTIRLLTDTLNSNPPLDAEVRMRARLDALRVQMESSTETHLNETLRPRRWLTPSRSMAVLVAVALLFVIVLLPLGSTSAIAQIAEKVSQKTWMHAHGIGPDGQPSELWFSATHGIIGGRTGESLFLIDQVRGTMDVYLQSAAPDSVQRVPLEHVPMQGIRAVRQSFLALLTGDVKQAMNVGDAQIMEHQEQPKQVDGRQLIEHRFVLGIKGAKQHRLESRLQVDPQTGLPISWSTKLGDQVICDYQVSYPERGPLTIAALGVSETVPIIDQTPTGEFQTVLLTTKTSRRRFDDYHAVVIESGTADRAAHGTGYRVWRKGNRWRIDQCLRMFHKDEVPAPGVDPEVWWLQQVKLMRSYPSEIWDGKRLWKFERNYATPRRPDPTDPHALLIESLSRTSTAAMDPDEPVSSSLIRLPEHVGYESLSRGTWFGYRAETRPELLNGQPMIMVDIIKTFDKQPKSISPDRFWLDPQRGGLICRRERFEVREPLLAVNPSEVVLAGRTPQGLWYPQTVRDIGSSISLEDNTRSDWYTRYYLEFETEIPEELFDAERVDLMNFWTQAK